MSDVFLSYASPDHDRAAEIAGCLSQRGYSVWWDRTIPPGRVFDEVIQEALDGASCVVVLWSRTSATSNWVKTEAAEGAKRHVLVPAVLDDVPIPMEFRRIQAAHLQGWTGDAAHPELEQLMQSVQRIVQSAGSTDRPRLDRSAPGGVRRPRWGRARWMGLGLAAVGIAAGSFFLGAFRFAPKGLNAPAVSTAPSPGGAPSDSRAVPNVSFGSAPVRKPVTSAAADPETAPVIPEGRINLLSKDNGATLVTASSDQWSRMIDGDDAMAMLLGEAAFAFRNEHAAVFDTFTVLIADEFALNLRDFELLISRESPVGPFTSIGKFHTRNMKLFKTPYQEFTFPPVQAKYLKVRAISSHAAVAVGSAGREFQLWGRLE